MYYTPEQHHFLTRIQHDIQPVNDYLSEDGQPYVRYRCIFRHNGKQHTFYKSQHKGERQPTFIDALVWWHTHMRLATQVKSLSEYAESFNFYIFSEESYATAQKEYKACLRSADAFHRVFSETDKRIIQSLTTSSHR